MPPTQETADVLVLGGGAAGLFAAIEAGKRGRRVLVLEHNAEVGRKILLSGGGRCNFTNARATAERYHSGNPHFARSALAAFTPADFVALVDRHRIPWHEKQDGQLFGDRSAKDIVALLRAECEAAGARIATSRAIGEVRHEDGFAVVTDAGEVRAASLIVATGGLSIPKAGATDFGHRLAERFGHRLVPCRPALVPFAFAAAEQTRYSDLAGIAVTAEVEAGGRRFRDGVLFTHRGLSGPAVLNASSFWAEGETVTVDLLPDVDVLGALLRRKETSGRATARTVLAEHLPDRLAARFAEGPRTLAEETRAGLERLAENLHRFAFVPAGTEGYGKAEVTAGGVDTRDLSGKTMESRLVPGLYFAGEVVDVTGELGGFNFQWAWSSGFVAGRNA